MKRWRIRLLIVFGVFLMSAALLIQFFLTLEAYELQQKQFSYDVTQALKNVVSEITALSNDTLQYQGVVTQLQLNLFKVSISEPLYPFFLEALLKNEFRKQAIDYDFEYSIYDCFTDSVVFKKGILASEGELEKKSESQNQSIVWDDEGHYFSVYFPHINVQVISRLRYLLYSTLVLIVVIAFFAYTLNILIQQKRTSDVKTDFVNNMTHELKTPISTIALATKTLSKPEITKQPERLKSYVDIIAREIERMKLQIDKVLQVAVIERGQIQLNLTPVNIHKLILDTVKVFEVSLEEKSGNICLNLHAANFIVLGDETHITNILINLIDNAIKYSDDSVQVTVETQNTVSGLKLMVSDNGHGIPENQIDLIFDKFYRVSQGNLHNTKGFGLGLHYAHAMVLAHHGSIKVKSKLGKGSTFEIIIPLIKN